MNWFRKKNRISGYQGIRISENQVFGMLVFGMAETPTMLNIAVIVAPRGD